MEGKLIKINNIYTLIVNDRMIASNDEDFQKDYEVNKLSLKNCQAIENGYDLDELVLYYEKEYEEHIQIDERQKQAFKIGFKKALEILGDNKFSEDDMNNAIELCIKLMNDKGSEFREHKQTVIQSLRQTEWDVEIETTYSPIHKLEVFGDNNIEIHEITNESPKRDIDGCLILRRI